MEPSQLSDFCSITMGQSPKGDECNSSGVGSPLLNGPTEFQLIHPSPVQWTSNPKKFSKPGDLLFCVRGSTTGRMNWSDQEYAIGRGLASISPIHEDTVYFFRGAVEAHLPTLLAGATGSTFPNVSRSDLESIPIPRPDLTYIKNASSVLKALERKIELNHKMNQTLEKIAKAIFKSWFVDFDPVRAKAEGRPTGLPPEISDLFPDEFVDSEIGEIPKGWEITSLGDVCDQVTKGTTPTSVGGRFSEDGNILFVKVESVSEDGRLLPSKFAKIDEETDSLLKRSQLREGDVLLSIAGTIGRSTIMPKRFLPANTNQAIAILRCRDKEDFVLQTLRSDHIQQNFHSKIVQAVQANLSLGEIKATRCVLPPLDVHDQLIDMIKQIREANEIRDQETSILAELRDTLLPKLIAGELRIPDAEKFLAEVGI